MHFLTKRDSTKLRIKMNDPSLITLTQDLVFCMSVESAAERYIYSERRCVSE